MKSSPDKPSRRDVLTGGGAAIVASQIPGQAQAAKSYENVPVTPEDLAYFDNLRRNLALRLAFQENPTREELESVIRVLATFSADWVPSIERRRETLHAGARALFNARDAFIGNGTALRIRDARYPAPPPQYRYVLVTAAHVADGEALHAGRWVRHPQFSDVSVCELTEREVTRDGKMDALHFGTTENRLRFDITGEVGVVLARDNDTGELKRKLFESMASPLVNRSHIDALGFATGDLYQTEGLRLIVLPRGEADVLVRGRPAQGVSGSAFLHVSPGDIGVEFGGMFVSVLPPIKIGNEMYAVGHIVDHIVAREAIDHLFSLRG